MPYRDTWATCTQCGKQFVFTVEEQRRQAQQDGQATPPQRCPSCQGSARPARRTETRGPSAPRPSPEQKTEATVALGPGPHEGSVKWYDGEKGYGFIVHPGGDEIFFHRTGIAPGEEARFPDGTRVTYLIEQTEKGPQAVDVARMDTENNTPGE